MRSAWKRVLLLFWVVGILFPFAWLSRYSASYQAVFDYIFGSTAAHVLMHTFLFGVLAYLLGVYFVGERPTRRKQLSLLLAAVVGVAVLQEGFQLLVQARFPGWPELFDLGVDIGGAILGMLAFRLWQEHRA